jgi:hypothetical protein
MDSIRIYDDKVICDGAGGNDTIFSWRMAELDAKAERLERGARKKLVLTPPLLGTRTVSRV